MPRWPLICAAVLALLTGVTACTPGPQHALWPRQAGLVQTAPGIWTDDPKATAEAVQIIAQAQQMLAALFGVRPEPDRIILCSDTPCAERFRLHTIGLAYGERLVLLGPEGLNRSTITHELVHVATARGLSLRALIDPPFPYWFVEGLAVHLAPPDPRYVRPEKVEDAVWITRIETLRQWKDQVTQDSYPATYGAAGRMVEEMEARMGRPALLAMVTDVQEGARRFEMPLWASQLLDP